MLAHSGASSISARLSSFVLSCPSFRRAKAVIREASGCPVLNFWSLSCSQAWSSQLHSGLSKAWCS